MKRLTAFVSGKVQKTGYRARIIDFARMLRLRGSIENLDDGRVKIIAEGDEDKLKWFEEAINIKNALIQVSSIEKEYSESRGDFGKFYKLVEKGETDSRLDTAASHLKDLLIAVNNMNGNLGSKIDQMNENLSGKMDMMIELQENTLNGQEDLLEEVRESRRDLKGYLDQRFEKLESEVTEMRTALKAKGII
ncbi:Acylphosphatase [uncultured archaeon]|nr:Acylphosphatase [uncultured archaeon]